MFYDVSHTLKYLGPYSTRNHTEYFVITYKGKEYEKLYIYIIYIWLNHFAVHLKLTNTDIVNHLYFN